MAAWSVHFIKCYKYKFLLLFGNFFSILFLIVALVSGQSINNGARWVHIAGISFQPSEIAKGVLIVGTATLIANEYKMGKTSAKSLYITTGLSLITFLFIVTQNLSTALIVFACSYAPFIFFPPPFKAIKKVTTILLGLGLFGVFCFSLLPKDPDAEIYKNPLMQRVSTWRNRVSGDSFKKTANPNDFEITDRNRQVVNARIAIARSLLRNRSIMIFDEATSALDPETEKKLLKNILSTHDKTVIFITHRPAVVEYCDQTLTIEKIQ